MSNKMMTDALRGRDFLGRSTSEQSAGDNTGQVTGQTTVKTRGIGYGALAIVVAIVLSGCALLPTGSKQRREHVYLIAPERSLDARVTDASCGVIQVAAGDAEIGHRGASMVYTQSDFEIEYFAYARWGDAPKRMLRDQMRRFLRDSGAFSGVLASPVVAQTDYQLDITDVAVRQHFEGESSTLHLSFEARIFDKERRYVLGSRRFETQGQAEPDPESGVIAANAAARALLIDTVDFVLDICREPTP